jgi:hypothetical protein
MTRPAGRLRALAARLCSPTTMERLIDPIVADLQIEYDEAIRHGRTWRSRWIRLAGYVAFLKAIVLYGAEQSTGVVSNWTPDDRQGVRRTIGLSVAITIVATLVLMLPPFFTLPSSPYANLVRLLLFVLPQALPIAAPVGFTLGILWAMGSRALSARLTGALVGMALVSSIGSLVMLAWVVPVANQAFRASAFGGHPPKGANELTLGELKQLLEPGTHEPVLLLPPSDMRWLEVSYYLRWALSFAPLALAVFALALISRHRFGRVIYGLIAGSAFLLYYVLLTSGVMLARDGTLPAFAAVWLANGVFVVLSAALLNVVHRRSSRAAQT